MKNIVIAAALAFGIVGTANAETIRATSSFGPKHVLAVSGYPMLFKKLKEFTDGRWTGSDTPSGLLAPNEMNAGLRDGVSEMGPIIIPYFAADYLESGIVGELSMLGTDNRAISSAVTEYIATCGECVKEFSRNGQVYLGSDATTNYQFLSTVKIDSLDDLKGVRIRTAGSAFSSFVQKLGAQSVQLPSTEIFEALSSGVLNATYSSVADLKNAQLYDVVKFVTLVDKGVFNAAALSNVSQVVWDKMTIEDRGALAHAAQYSQAIATYSWRDTSAEAEKIAKERGIIFIKPNADFTTFGDKIRDEHMSTIAEKLSKKGIKNSQSKIDRYSALLKKWEGLVVNVKSADELAELRNTEIWNKIDLKTYGSH